MFNQISSNMHSYGCKTGVTTKAVFYSHGWTNQIINQKNNKKTRFDWLGGENYQNARFPTAWRLTDPVSLALSQTLRNWLRKVRQGYL